MKIAAYLDEISDDPSKACKIVESSGLRHICLRRIKSHNIADITDETCQQLMHTIRSHNLNVVCVASHLGRLPQKSLTPISQITRAIHITSYFKAKFLRIFNGLGTEKAPKQLEYWMRYIATECLKADITPVLEIDPDATITNSADVEIMLKSYPPWRLLFDPASVVLRRRCDPYQAYWSKLKDYIVALDLHDYKIGSGFRLFGTGDCHLPLMLRDINDLNLDIWLFIEHGLRNSLKTRTSGSDLLQSLLVRLNHLI